MAEIEITLPTVQYGNVKIRATPEELGIPDISSADQLGIVTAIYLNLFTQGFKVGSTMDVSAPQGASQSEVDQVIDETLKAAQIIAEGLGGATEVEYQGTAEGQRAAVETETTTQSAPWTETVVDAPKKPWEDEGW
jgi:hypothetical protein